MEQTEISLELPSMPTIHIHLSRSVLRGFFKSKIFILVSINLLHLVLKSNIGELSCLSLSARSTQQTSKWNEEINEGTLDSSLFHEIIYHRNMKGGFLIYKVYTFESQAAVSESGEKKLTHGREETRRERFSRTRSSFGLFSSLMSRTFFILHSDTRLDLAWERNEGSMTLLKMKLFSITDHLSLPYLHLCMHNIS